MGVTVHYRGHLDDLAQQYLKEGDWAGYGKELDALQAVLNQLAELTSTK